MIMNIKTNSLFLTVVKHLSIRRTQGNRSPTHYLCRLTVTQCLVCVTAVTGSYTTRKLLCFMMINTNASKYMFSFKSKLFILYTCKMFMDVGLRYCI